MLQRKRELGLTFEKLSELSGVPVSTIQNYLYGYTDSPRYDTISAIENVLEEKRSYEVNDISVSKPSYYGKEHGEYTVDDYDQFPEDQRCELIDGVIYDMGAPSLEHQEILHTIVIQLSNCIIEHQNPCKLFFAPVDVVLGEDNKTVVQPDLIIVCDPEKLSRKDKVYGAPDLAVEIVSPWSEKKDKRIKLAKYAETGVREYWIVDPFKKMVLVYVFDAPELIPTIYPFGKQIPVGISEGKCSVDLSSFA